MTNYDEKTLQWMTLIEAEMGSLLASDAEESNVLEAMRYCLLGGGKRIRGILTLATCELVGADAMRAAPAASAIEMLHCYSLIHDDLPAMDDSPMRRGKPSCHVAFGESTAILAGDALLTVAFLALTKLQDPRTAMECVEVLARAAGHKGMVLGQELDLAAQGRVLTPAQLTRMQSYKTGALIGAAMRMGAIIGGATQQQLNAISEYATNLGIVFQLVDDILDASADEQELGKPIGGDAALGKATGTTLFGVERARRIATELTAKAIAALTAHFSNTDYLVEFAKRQLTRNK